MTTNYTECAYCGHVTTDGHDVPEIHNDAAWSALAAAHAHDCEWITTRAHRVWHSIYRVKMIDRDTPQSWIGLCASVQPTNQDGEYCHYTVTTSHPEALEAAMEADDDVVSYEIIVGK